MKMREVFLAAADRVKNSNGFGAGKYSCISIKLAAGGPFNIPYCEHPAVRRYLELTVGVFGSDYEEASDQLQGIIESLPLDQRQTRRIEYLHKAAGIVGPDEEF